MPLTALIGLINTITTIALALFVFFKNPLGKTHRAYLLFGLCVGLYSIGYFLWGMSKTASDALFAFKVLTTGIILINTGYLEFAFNLLQVRKQKRWLLFAIHILNVLFVILVWNEGLFASVGRKNIWGYWPYPKPLFYAYFLMWVCQMGYGLFAIRKGYLLAPSRQAVQLRYVFYSALIGYIGGGTNWLPWFGINFPPYLNALVTVYVGILAYAIVRYRIMDIQMVVTRTGILALIYGIIIGMPAFLIFQMRDLLEQQLGVNWWLLPAGLFSLLSFIGPFVYLILQRRAEALLSKEQKAYQQTLLQASKGMTLIKDLNRLLTLIVHILTKTIRITHARIFLSDNEGKQFICKAARGDHHKQGSDVVSETAALIQHIRETKEALILEEIRAQGAISLKLSDEVIREMEKLDAAVVVPSFVQDRLLGFVVLGDKKSKRLYTESDLDTLATLANQAALAIENCIFLSEFENQQIHFFQTAKMADLGTMASGISHQVNNRFNTIGAGAEFTSMIDLKTLRTLMERDNLPQLKPVIESLEDTIKKIRDDAMKGGEIATNLLRFSKKSEGFQAVDLDKAVQTCIRLWGCKRDLSLIDFENKVSQDLPKIRGNFSQVEEVLFNLLDNAYDATLMKKESWELGKRAKPEGEWKGKVSVSARPLQREDKGYLEITIQDNGIGMDTTTRQHIFLPFFTTKGANKGTGLGLYVMKRIVEAHEGEIQVDSEDGVGTTFRVLFHQAKETDKKL